MRNNNDFAFNYDQMSKNYSKLENIMGTIYRKMESGEDVESSKFILVELGSVAQGMLGSQIEFTRSYGDSAIKETLINNLEEKSMALNNALEQTRSNTRSH